MRKIKDYTVMEQPTLLHVYKKRIEQSDLLIKKIRKNEIVFAVFKLIVVGFGIFSLYKITTGNQSVYLGLLAASMILFGVAAVFHENTIRKRQKIETLRAINEMELKYLQNGFPVNMNGEDFRDTGHNFSNDLDIFGTKSVFHYINRAHTSVGQQTLASWLKSSPELNQGNLIKSRQQAVKELTPALDLRQNIQVYGKQIDDSMKKLDALTVLLNEPLYLSNKKLLVWIIRVAPFATLALIVLIGFGVPWQIPVAALFIQALINRRFRKKNTRIFLLTSRNSKILKAYANIIAEIENAEFSSAVLQDLRRNLSFSDQTASHYIRRFSLLFSFFELRQSEWLHFLMDNLLFWDLHCVYFIEKWKKNISSQLLVWFDSIGQFEAISSFACLHFNHPDWTLPTVSDSDFSFEASSLGHFLIPEKERICNDVLLKGKGNIMVVTGPNMAGKSTFLKTIGVNLVLALSGGPVCALKCSITPVKLYSAMKVSDSLDKSLSLFYAELQRLKNILDGINKQEQVFFLMDEILKGTNALDRQMGAIALLKQLTEQGASGIVATHDLELTKLEKDFPKKIINYHFDGFVEGDKLLFDYRLNKGRCESFNALVLMRRIGIDI